MLNAIHSPRVPRVACNPWLVRLGSNLFPPGLLLCSLCLLLTTVGCGSSVNMQTWQNRVEEYVWAEANGDPNALRDTTWAGSQKGFAIIGLSVPEASTDANGVLLGHRQINGRPWFIFLVGLVEKQVVEDIRLAALSADAGQFHWVVSDRNTEAVETYRQYLENNWKTLFPERTEPPAWYLRFPAENDAFDLSISDDGLLVKHRPSGAQWSLQISQMHLTQSWLPNAQSPAPLNR